jgi:hypothetical protein
MQSTAPHWTLMVVDVLVALTEVGGPEGAASLVLTSDGVGNILIQTLYCEASHSPSE